MKTLLEVYESITDQDDDILKRDTSKTDILVIVQEFVKYLGIGLKNESNNIGEVGFQLPIFMDCENPKKFDDPIQLYKYQSNKMIKKLKDYGIIAKLHESRRTKIELGLDTILNYSFHRNRKFIASFHINIFMTKSEMYCKLLCGGSNISNRDIYQLIIDQIKEQEQ